MSGTVRGQWTTPRYRGRTEKTCENLGAVWHTGYLTAATHSMSLLLPLVARVDLSSIVYLCTECAERLHAASETD